MSDLTVIEKYPPGRRIEHPDFGDVCKTTFAKGVITDFEKISDDPIQVASRVKVEVDGQASDWLPIVFHPKAQYWDDAAYAGDSPGQQEAMAGLNTGTIKATDFNQSKAYHERAWMSFRIDDEVVVMFKEGNPVAVMGFADGVPREGENIGKIDFWTYQYENHSRDWNYIPGNNTDLVVPPEHHIVYIDFLKKTILDDGSYAAYLAGNVWQDLPEPTPDGISLGIVKEAEIICYKEETLNLTNWPASWQDTQRIYKMVDIGFIIGPILYIFQFMVLHSASQWAAEGNPAGWGWWVSGGLQGVWVCALPYSKKNLDACKAAAASSTLTPKQVCDNAMALGGGLFGSWGIEYPDAVKQETLFDSLRYTFSRLWDMNPDVSKYHVRPHTKVELEAAGMWPTA